MHPTRRGVLVEPIDVPRDSTYLLEVLEQLSVDQAARTVMKGCVYGHNIAL